VKQPLFAKSLGEDIS